jgi:acetyl esterase
MEVTMGCDIRVEDVEYIRHDSSPLLMRLYRPEGTGPFPIMVELHGGAWCKHDRLADTLLHEPLARSGVIVASLDFRQPPVAPYPASLQDIHYAIRWLKARANELGSRPDMVGSMGNSSGAHQAMLLGMRPFDPRYSALPSPGTTGFDGTVRCVVMFSPVIDPIARYHFAKTMKEAGPGGLGYHQFVETIPALQEAYWQSEEAMAEGTPALALERGEKTELPPVLCISGPKELMHPRPHLDRFVAAYQNAGGALELQMFEGAGMILIEPNPEAPAFRRAVDLMVEYVHRQMGTQSK